MFKKKRATQWFAVALTNLMAAALIYKLARGFQKIAQRQNAHNKIQYQKTKVKIFKTFL